MIRADVAESKHGVGPLAFNLARENRVEALGSPTGDPAPSQRPNTTESVFDTQCDIETPGRSDPGGGNFRIMATSESPLDPSISAGKEFPANRCDPGAFLVVEGCEKVLKKPRPVEPDYRLIGRRPGIGASDKDVRSAWVCHRGGPIVREVGQSSESIAIVTNPKPNRAKRQAEPGSVCSRTIGPRPPAALPPQSLSLAGLAGSRVRRVSILSVSRP